MRSSETEDTLLTVSSYIGCFARLLVIVSTDIHADRRVSIGLYDSRSTVSHCQRRGSKQGQSIRIGNVKVKVILQILIMLHFLGYFSFSFQVMVCLSFKLPEESCLQRGITQLTPET